MMKKGLMLLFAAIFALPIVAAGGYRGGRSGSSQKNNKGSKAAAGRKETRTERKAREAQANIRRYYTRA